MKITQKINFETTMGNFVVGLYGEEMPVTCENFVEYVNAGYYKNLVFHRVIKGFVIQGGGFMKGMIEKQELYPPIKLETSPDIKHTKYTLSMARTNEPNSASSQFFVCLEDVHSLDADPSVKAPNGYAAFGTVVEGQDVVDAIGQVDTHSVKWFDDVPVEPVVIKSATLV